MLLLGPQRRLQLLALLGLEARWAERERLAALFWPGRDAHSARGNLRKVLHELRGLGVQGIEEGPAGLRWLISSDTAVFARARAAADWPAAAAAGAGSLMEGVDDARTPAGFADWLHQQRSDHSAQWRGAVLQAVATSDAAQALAWGQALLQMDPLDEDALAVAWRAAQALKLPALASELWQSYCLHLKTELGLEPAQVLRNMVEGDDGTATHLPITEMVGRRGELQELTEIGRASCRERV